VSISIFARNFSAGHRDGARVRHAQRGRDEIIAEGSSIGEGSNRRFRAHLSCQRERLLVAGVGAPIFTV
jgi:hypothetical protein